eukprot:CAMPEP_0201896230 /NCGR_PEP_ID=MMETSP0902-20130614/44179_1 /ASSEMBLY_ACC=CAM_ASM_000551 /TAXON_ID=420261 /ORGANISM="Thalassiosira antarctica, Strain CCMP982" /LENGTH=126 /DNA_ID=CAMNT_0048428759 /DNA_START=122 /DNA_END=502 /DNA_ORIENTATION=-
MSFDVVGKKNANGKCKVFTRAGDYQGHEEDESGWELILDKTVEMKQNVHSNLGALDRDVTIPTGSRQAFYIFCRKGMLYTRGNTDGSPFDSDGSLVINDGIGTRRLFQKVTGNAQYSGWIRYYASA